MSRKFQNNYRGGWDDNMPFDDFNQEEVYYNYEVPHDRDHHYADDRYLSHETPAHYADDRYLSHEMLPQYADDGYLSHEMPAHYVDDRHLPHRTPAHYVDDRHLPHQMSEHYADKRHLTHQTAEDYADKRHIAYQTPERYADKRYFAHQTDGHYADNKRYFSHQTEEHYADTKRYFSPQLEEHYADKKSYFSPQTEEHYADKKRYFSPQLEEHYVDKKRYFSPQLEEHYADKKSYFSPQTEEHYVDKKRYFPHQTEEHYADKKRYFLPQMEEHCADKKRYFPHQTEEHRADKKRYYAHQTEEHFADKRHFPHQIPEDCADKKGLPHQTRVDFGGKRHLSRQKSKDYSDKRYMAQQKPETYGDKRHLLHQMPKVYADSRRLPRRTQKHYADKKRHLPHQTEEHYIDKKRHLPHQMPEDYADKKCASHQRPEDFTDKKHVSHQKLKDNADNKCLPHKTPDHYADKRHFPQQTREHYGDKRHLPDQMPKEYADKKCLSHQTPKPTIPAVAPVHRRQSNTTCCKICDVKMHRKFLEKHNNGKKHQMLLELHEQSMKHKISNGRHSRQIPNSSEMDPVVQPKKVPKSKKNGQPVENVSQEARSLKHKKVPAESSKLGDHTGAKDHGSNVENVSHEAPNFKHKKVPATSSKSKLADDTGAKDCGFKVESVKNESPSFKNRKVPAVRSKRKLRDDTGAKDHGFKPEIGGATGGKYLKMNNGIRNPVKSSKPVVNAQVFTPAAAEGSTFESKNRIDSQREVTEAKEHHEVLNNGVDSNDERRSISMELHYSAGSNTQIEVVNSNSAANEIVTEPLASTPSDAVGSSFDIEPQESEAVAYYESQHPTDETDIELLPSVLMEIDAHSESSVETETADRSSQDEVDTVVLSNESGITKLAQVSVCLTCGHEGFQETLVYCKKCEDCALHRYCLDGPVIFTDEVIWFCEDCEAEVIDTDYSGSETKDSEKGEVDSSKECFTVVDPQPIANAIWRHCLKLNFVDNSGSLQILNKSYDKSITRLMCHLSTLACPKVLESTRHLPNVLYADMIQRSAVWPESFRKFGTNNLSIGLYFFPQNERVERYFDHLVDEMISNDLAIRARVEKAELLIFPSTMLPSQCKRFQSKYYLWGIFKKPAPSTTCDAD